MERKRIIVITPEERKYLQKMIGCSGVTVWEAVKYRKSNDIHKRIRRDLRGQFLYRACGDT